MLHERINAADAAAIDLIPQSCGEVTVGCADAGGIVERVIEASGRMH